MLILQSAYALTSNIVICWIIKYQTLLSNDDDGSVQYCKVLLAIKYKTLLL